MANRKLFKSKKALKEAVDDYFNKQEEKHAPLTLTGLARHLSMGSRQTLLNYSKTDEFGDIIQEARMRVEEYAEKRLYDRDGARGAEFNLKFNFNWGKDAEEDEAKTKKTEETQSEFLKAIKKAVTNED